MPRLGGKVVGCIGVRYDWFFYCGGIEMTTAG
jgi:hypothetical protein